VLDGVTALGWLVVRAAEPPVDLGAELLLLFAVAAGLAPPDR
jgi:hypothetical protein